MTSLQVVFLYWLSVTTFIIGNAGAEPINPKRVLVTTVIDTSNAEIVRDSLTLFRSIRLFGDTFNDATFLAYITLEDSFVDNAELLANLSSLRINWDFIRPVEGYIPKTMNKILTFQKFDSLKYDYMLWLDADVVLFRDPMPYFYAHQYPGQIQCAPDVYNYMKRFPHLNGSEIVWNTVLAEYQLDGHNEYAPHGLCNTGVILFDKLSLATFMGGLNETIETIRPINPYKRDRFLDSLVFVAIVNRYHIDVIIRGYEMNFMSFFEIEIQESSNTGDIIFAHLITHTDLYCVDEVSASDGVCRCVYHNTNLKEISLIFNAMGKANFGDQNVCKVLAGSMSIREYEQLGYNTYLSYDSGISGAIHLPSVELTTTASTDPPSLLLSWPVNGGMIFHDHASGSVPIQLQWECTGSNIDGSSSSSKTGDILMELRTIVDREGPEGAYPSILLGSEKLTAVSVCNGILVDRLQFSMNTDQSKDGEVDNAYYRRGETTVQLVVTVTTSSPQLSQQMGSVKVNENIAIQTDISDISTSSMHVNFTLFQNSLAHPGLARFSDNLLLGRRPLTLDTQLNIPSYLHLWGHGKGYGSFDMRTDSYGAVVCCESASGVGVVESLITTWAGDVLVIYVRKLPNTPPPTCLADNILPPSASDWITYLDDLCRSSRTGVRCAIFDLLSTTPTTTASRDDIYTHGMYLLNKYDLRFVYIDVYESYSQHRDGIIRWLDMLPKGSILFGSRYTSHTLDECHELETAASGASIVPCVSGPKAAVDAAAYATRRIAMATHSEESSGSIRSGANKYCRAYRNIERSEHSIDDRDICRKHEATANSNPHTRYTGPTNTVYPNDGDVTQVAQVHCALDTTWSYYSPTFRRIRGGLPDASECHVRPSENDCAPAWYFIKVSQPLEGISTLV